MGIFDKNDQPYDAEGIARHIALALEVQPPDGSLDRLYYQAIKRLFDPCLVDADNIPDRPCLFVGNHSLFALDGFLMVPVMQHEQGRFLRALADRFMWNSVTESLLLKRGGVIGNPAVCSALMEQGSDLLVFPGGAHEATKTAAQKYTLQWRERYGFVRLAALHGYTIMPFAMVGPDEFYDHLIEGEDLPDTAPGRLLTRLGLLGENTRLDILPPIPRGALGTLLPKPQRCYIQFGQPMDLAALAGKTLTSGRLQILRARVAAQIESMLEQLLQLRASQQPGILRWLLTR